jgi:hypothetical protein
MGATIFWMVWVFELGFWDQCEWVSFHGIAVICPFSRALGREPSPNAGFSIQGVESALVQFWDDACPWVEAWEDRFSSAKPFYASVPFLAQS